MKKAALKKELREIDRRLARFGVLSDNDPKIGESITDADNMIESIYDFALGRDPEDTYNLINHVPATRLVSDRQRNAVN